VKPPWEVDGRRWHTRDRVSRSGRPAQWEGAILERIVDRIEALGDFAPADWSQRTSVRVFGRDRCDPPFFHAATSAEWVVTLRFTVPRNTFKPLTLARQLALVPFHEAETPVHSEAERLAVETSGATQQVVITCHAAADLETPAFDEFLARAAAAYQRLGQSGTGSLVLASELA
jgi:excinuclease ABC subunit A